MKEKILRIFLNLRKFRRNFFRNSTFYILNFKLIGGPMIELTGMDKKDFILNADHIEKIEEVPETIITLTNGKKYIVLQSVDEVINEVIKYKNRIFNLKL